MAQSVLPRTTPLLLFTLFPLMPTAVPRDPEKKVTFWLCCKGYFGKKPCREAHKVTLPYNQLGMTEFEDLRDQITQHVLDKHWPKGDADSIKDSYEFGDLQCWDKWDKNTQYVLPEPKQVTPGTSSSPEPEARRSRSPKQSRRRSIVQEHGSFFFFPTQTKGFFFFPKPKYRWCSRSSDRESKSTGRGNTNGTSNGRESKNTDRESRNTSRETEKRSEDLPKYIGTMKLNEFQSEAIAILRRLDGQFTKYLKQAEKRQQR